MQQPPYIPPEASIPNEVGYSSGSGEKAYYSWIASKSSNINRFKEFDSNQIHNFLFGKSIF